MRVLWKHKALSLVIFLFLLFSVFVHQMAVKQQEANVVSPDVLQRLSLQQEKTMSAEIIQKIPVQEKDKEEFSIISANPQQEGANYVPKGARCTAFDFWPTVAYVEYAYEGYHYTVAYFPNGDIDKTLRKIEEKDPVIYSVSTTNEQVEQFRVSDYTEEYISLGERFSRLFS